MNITSRLATLAVALVAWASAPAQTPPPDAAPTLLTHAASDFHAHMKPPPTDFRRVRLGQLASTDGHPRPVLCGEFKAGPKSPWTAFATIQTDPYEQWIGGAAAGYCKPPTFQPTGSHDLSPALKQRLSALPDSQLSTPSAR